MGKYDFFNSIIDDESFVKYLAVMIKSDLLMESFEDDLRILSNKIKAQYGYSFDFDYLDFKNKKVISDYELNPTDDVYAQKIDDKRIYIVFNKRLKSNFNRYLFLKVWAYDILDLWKKGDTLFLSIKNNSTDNDILAERIAIENKFLLENLNNNIKELEKRSELIKKLNNINQEEILFQKNRKTFGFEIDDLKIEDKKEINWFVTKEIFKKNKISKYVQINNLIYVKTAYNQYLNTLEWETPIFKIRQIDPNKFFK